MPPYESLYRSKNAVQQVERSQVTYLGEQVVYDNTQAAYWDNQTFVAGTVKVPLGASLVQGSMMTTSWTRTVPTGTTQDRATFGVHFTLNAGPGAPMSRLADSDCVSIEGKLLTEVWPALFAFMSGEWTLTEILWRHFGADFPIGPDGLSKPGPIFRISPQGLSAGGTVARMPDQVAMTVSLRTASRKHWGRFYLGGLQNVTVSNTTRGMITPACVDAVCDAWHALFNDLSDDARIIEPVVWSPRYRGALSVSQLVVDDVFDVVRSRRAKFASHRKIHS